MIDPKDAESGINFVAGECLQKRWRVVYLETGEFTDVGLVRSNAQSEHKAWYGFEPPTTVRDAHRIMTYGTVIDRGSDRTRYGGATEEMQKRLLLRGWGTPRSAEDQAPRGWAADWFTAVLAALSSNADWLDGSIAQSKSVPPSGVAVARQLARLADGGPNVTIPDRSLRDAVGRADRSGRTTAYMESGVSALIHYGLIEKQVTGRGRGAKTTYTLIRPQ